MSNPQSAVNLSWDATNMYRESKTASEIIAAQLQGNLPLIEEAVSRIIRYQPNFVATLARGSSDCAALYAKYLIETQLGLMTASAAPSMSSVYAVRQKLEKTLFIVISQSGASPDILAGAARAKEAGALVLALVNTQDSPLCKRADIVLPLRAGTERSVAATKSFLATLSAIVHLVSVWSKKQSLSDALYRVPALLSQAWEHNWIDTALPLLQPATNMFVIGRGYGLGVALEAALKLKETCNLHAEGYSQAEVKHGPMAIVNQGFPLLFLGQADNTQKGMAELAADFRARGAHVLYAGEGDLANLAVVKGVHPAIAPLLNIQSFYRLVNALAVSRGYNPDHPPHLKKVTETV